MHCSFSVIWRATGLAKPREESCVTPLGQGAAGLGHSAPPLTIQKARKTQELDAVNRGSTIPRHVLIALRRKPAHEPGELGTWLWDTLPWLISPALLQGFHRENWSPSWISEVPAQSRVALAAARPAACPHHPAAAQTFTRTAQHLREEKEAV